MKYRVVFFGSSEYCIPALDALLADSSYELVAVVSQPDKPAGRKQILTSTPVTDWARKNGIELLNAPSWKKVDPHTGENEYLIRLRSMKPDIGVLIYYGKILPQSVIDVFPKGIINTHPSLLPKYRGPTPGQMIILNGETESGVSIMMLEAGQDTGPILAQEKFEVAADETPATYYDKGFRIGTALLMKVLPDYLEGKLIAHHQDHYQATNTPLLSRDNGKIDWTQSVEQIERMVRAFTPWPGTWTEIWETQDGSYYLEDEMRARMGMTQVGRENWDGVTKKRLKILTVYIEEGQLIPDEVQIEGEQKVKFSSLKIVD